MPQAHLLVQTVLTPGSMACMVSMNINKVPAVLYLSQVSFIESIIKCTVLSHLTRVIYS